MKDAETVSHRSDDEKIPANLIIESNQAAYANSPPGL